MDIYVYDNFDFDKNIFTGNVNDLYIKSDNQPSEYSLCVDISVLNDLDYLFSDYLQKRTYIKNLSLGGWGSYSNKEKLILIDLYAHEDNEKAIIHLMTINGFSQQEAQVFLINRYAQHVVKDSESCYKRSKSKELTACVLTFLNPTDATDFLEVTEKLNELYTDRAIKGLDDGSFKSGLFDFIESKHEFLNQGLKEQGYILNFGTYDFFIGNLMSILRHGNYGS